MEAYDFDERLERAATPRLRGTGRRRFWRWSASASSAGRGSWRAAPRRSRARGSSSYDGSGRRAGRRRARRARGTLRAFSNVCRHRAGPVAAGAGERRVSAAATTRGRTRSTAGSGHAGVRGVEEFRQRGMCLPEFRVEEWARSSSSTLMLSARRSPGRSKTSPRASARATGL